MDEDDFIERSTSALKSFRDHVEQVGLWNEGWVSVVAIRGETKWIAFLIRLRLVAPGVQVPSIARVFDATTKDVIVRARRIGLNDCWRIVEECALDGLGSLGAIIGHDLVFPRAKNPSFWSASAAPDSRYGRAHLHASRSINAPFHDLFGWQLFERLGPQLRGHEPPYNSLREIADGMGFFGGSGCDNNSASPLFEISAEIPVGLVACFYNKARAGIELQIEVGADVPISRVSVSLTPEPRRRLSGPDFNVASAGAVRALSALVPCGLPQADVAVTLQFDDVHVTSSCVGIESAAVTSWPGLVGSRAQEEWEVILVREFHLTRRELRRLLRAVLPDGVANVAEWRIREGVRLREEHPFFAVVAAASVAEALVIERLSKVTRRRRVTGWADLRSRDPKLPRKLPTAEVLKFDHAIRLASQLGLLADTTRGSLRLLREARNEIHLGRSSRLPTKNFSPMRASQAILATLDLCESLSLVKRARSKSLPRLLP